MSTIQCTNISKQDGSASVPVNTIINGTAKAWAFFNGAGLVITRAAFNVSFVTDNGTGDYTVYFSTPMPDTNYTVTGGGQVDTSGAAGAPYVGIYRSASAQTTSTVRISTTNSAVAAMDYSIVCVVIFR